MNVLIDTSAWSMAFRRLSTNTDIASEVGQLIADHRTAIIGPIRQELLSGMSNEAQFHKLKIKLQAFVDHPVTTSHYEYAAELSNHCRWKGVIGSSVDFLICAVAKMEKLEMFTTDRDFEPYSKCIGLTLHKFPA